jgi:hypothetical protein
VSSGQDREFEAVVDFPRFIDTIRQSKKISNDNLSVPDCYSLGDFTCCSGFIEFYVHTQPQSP